jgi:ketosteroid isomerase-like protein
MSAFWIAAMCAASLSVGAQETSSASVEGKIVALEKLWNQAYKSGDTKALDTILDDSIVLINDDGSQQSKKEFLASVKTSNAQEQQVAPELLKVTVHGDVAIASGVLRAATPEAHQHRPHHGQTNGHFPRAHDDDSLALCGP